MRSGIRYDYVMADKDNKFMRELIEHHVSGQLKVAPEHMQKKFYNICKNQQETHMIDSDKSSLILLKK